MSLAQAEVDSMDLAQQLAKYKEENLRLSEEKNNIMREFNTRMKVHLEEVRLLKEVNERLQMELEDLRDLCCYLDDDRVKCRKLAKEWQNFGRFVSSTLHAKESSYQEEVNSLSLQRESVIAENINLKRLCHQLENCSSSPTQPREYVCIRCSQGILLDRSSNGVVRRNTDSPQTAYAVNHREKPNADVESILPQSPSTSFLSQDSYISEGSITGHKNGKRKKVSFIEPDEVHEPEDNIKHEPLDINSNGIKENRGILRNGGRNHHSNGHGSVSSNDSISSVQDINRAMQVLEIHSELEERDYEREEPLKDKEVAVLKEMCNVVWRKLSNDDPRSNSGGVNHRTPNRQDDEIVYEDLL
ncbi:coiled-coil domain-containing protein 85C-B-like [Dendronephthya gigantea]|uniref:coiled-coil domain-containing protein 85C-B-like n=1 Tax=Dendronephthya gigantea TaxID=151771 RepID=UPI00106C2BDB|nr:coiled-coil domain-containing protein 85C-B-like [Dendronephthya gigantea]